VVADFHINVLPALTNLFNKLYRPYRAPLNESGLNLPTVAFENTVKTPFFSYWNIFIFNVQYKPYGP